MDSKFMWDIFLETGAPEAYLLFQKIRRTEEHRVSDDKSACAPGHGLQ